MRNRFESQLQQLNAEMLKLGAMCEDAISCAVKCLMEEGAEREEGKEGALAAEQAIDRKEWEVEQLCIRLFMQQQPIAADFRRITSAMKMISDMERIGDQAEDIAEIAEYVTAAGLQNRINIADMARVVRKMVTDSVDSFVKQDVETAQNVIAKDDMADSLFLKIKKELIEAVRDGHENAEALVDLLMIAKYFERIGDHAENIAEWVIYAITGEHKNHME